MMNKIFDTALGQITRDGVKSVEKSVLKGANSLKSVDTQRIANATKAGLSTAAPIAVSIFAKIAFTMLAFVFGVSDAFLILLAMTGIVPGAFVLEFIIIFTVLTIGFIRKACGRTFIPFTKRKVYARSNIGVIDDDGTFREI